MATWGKVLLALLVGVAAPLWAQDTPAAGDTPPEGRVAAQTEPGSELAPDPASKATVPSGTGSEAAKDGGASDKKDSPVGNEKTTGPTNFDKVPFPRQAQGESTEGSAQPLSPGSTPPETNFVDGLVNLIIGLVLIGLIFGFLVWYLRRNPNTKRYFGGGPVKLLSRTYLGPKMGLFLVKAGERVLLIGQGQDGMRTLMEVSDPGEVSRLLAQVEEANPGSMTATFRSALSAASGAAASGKPSAGRSADASTGRSGASAKSVDARVGDDEDVIRVDPGYSAQLKLAALRGQMDKSKAGTP